MSAAGGCKLNGLHCICRGHAHGWHVHTLGYLATEVFTAPPSSTSVCQTAELLNPDMHTNLTARLKENNSLFSKREDSQDFLTQPPWRRKPLEAVFYNDLRTTESHWMTQSGVKSSVSFSYVTAIHWGERFIALT